VLNTLHWPDEIRSTEDLDIDNPAVSPAELKMAENLVGMMATKFEPEEYKDEYKKAILELVEAKVEKREVIAAAEPEAETTVVDLMAALKASVEKAKKSGQTTARGTRGGHESLVHKKAASTTKEKRRKAS
jgi:DNA end-binding protein Ku